MNINEVKVPLKTAINLLEQWGNDERAMELLHAILRDLDAEPPKPTPEQLKVLCVELDGSTPRGCKDGDYVWCKCWRHYCIGNIPRTHRQTPLALEGRARAESEGTYDIYRNVEMRLL